MNKSNNMFQQSSYLRPTTGCLLIFFPFLVAALYFIVWIHILCFKMVIHFSQSTWKVEWHKQRGMGISPTGSLAKHLQQMALNQAEARS